MRPGVHNPHQGCYLRGRKYAATIEHRRPLQVEQVVDPAHARQAIHGVLHITNLVGSIELAPQDDDAGFRVDADPARGDSRVTEKLGFDPIGKRNVIGHRPFLLTGVRDALGSTVRLGGRKPCARRNRLGRASPPTAEFVPRDVAPKPTAFAVPEIRPRGAQDCATDERTKELEPTRGFCSALKGQITDSHACVLQLTVG
jgi:hypothetical protein